MTAELLDEAPQQALKSLDRSGPRRLCRLDVEDARAGPAARLHRRLGRADRRTPRRCAASCCATRRPTTSAPSRCSCSLGHHEALVRRSRPRLRRAPQAVDPGDLGAFLPEWRSDGLRPAALALAAKARAAPMRGHLAGAAARAQRDHRARRPLLRPLSTSPRASCGSASPRSRCSTSSPAFRELATAAGRRPAAA